MLFKNSNYKFKLLQDNKPSSPINKYLIKIFILWLEGYYISIDNSTAIKLKWKSEVITKY